ncbi:uncharacterized protein LOC141733350 isoform X2 [Larus michahellis]|uniref:uncharacterized protein LOC141733350 isoform X2 n=1 Tax=Larus michahellis TaxID=119627 RepID=UPI003D9B30AA
MQTCLITAVPAADGHPTSLPDLVREPQGDPTDVAGVPQRSKSKAEKRKSSQRSSEVLKELLKELDKAAHVRDWGPVDKEALQEGGSRAVPVSDEATRALQSAGVPGVDGKRNTNAIDPQDFQKYWIEGAVAILGSVLFGMGLCCAIYLWRERKNRLSAASGAQPNPSSYPSCPDSRTTRPSTPESRPQPQQPSPVPGKAAHLPPSTQKRAPDRLDVRLVFPTPPEPPPLPTAVGIWDIKRLPTDS